MNTTRNTTSSSAYNYKVVRQFAIMTVVWGIVGMGLGVFIAAQLAWPELNFNLPWTRFGHLRPMQSNAVIFAFGGCALFASSYYAVQRTSQARLFAPRLAALSCCGWSAAPAFQRATRLYTKHAQRQSAATGRVYAETEPAAADRSHSVTHQHATSNWRTQSPAVPKQLQQPVNSHLNCATQSRTLTTECTHDTRLELILSTVATCHNSKAIPTFALCPYGI